MVMMWRLGSVRSVWTEGEKSERDGEFSLACKNGTDPLLRLSGFDGVFYALAMMLGG